MDLLQVELGSSKYLSSGAAVVAQHHEKNSVIPTVVISFIDNGRLG